MRRLLEGKTTTWPRQDILETNSIIIYITTLSKYRDGLHRILTEKFEKLSKSGALQDHWAGFVQTLESPGKPQKWDVVVAEFVTME